MDVIKNLYNKRFVKFGELTGIETSEGGVLLKGEGGSVRISNPMEGVLLIRSGRGGRMGDGGYFAPSMSGKAGPDPEVVEKAAAAEVFFPGFRLIAARKPYRLSVYDSSGNAVFKEYPGLCMGWTETGVALAHSIDRHSGYFGFGEKTGPFNKLGRKMEMWNADKSYSMDTDPIYMSIPFALILREGEANGLLFDNPGRAGFDLGATFGEVFGYNAAQGELDLYVMLGPTPAQVLSRYADVTGHAPMPPRWALGHHQSRWSYKNEEEVRGIAREFRERDVPSDVIHLDIHYMDRYRSFTIDRERFPDMKAMSGDLAESGFKLISIVDPGLAADEEYEPYREGVDNDYFLRDSLGREFRARVWPGKVAFPDFSRPGVGTWWGDMHSVLIESGIRGIWNDMNEPACWRLDARVGGSVAAVGTIKDPDLIHEANGRKLDHEACRNLYAMDENRATREGLERLRPGERPFILTRAGYAGVQSLAAVWTGDNSSAFNHLALSVRMLLNLGLSGVGLCGADVGGFKGNCSPELYARWIQLGAFYPFSRTHSAIWTSRQEPWSFGAKVESIARRYLKLRYRLHPAMYSLVREHHESGAPVFRPLFYDFPEDRVAPRIDDQVMIGPWIMIAPVMEKGSRRREVYLPEAKWTDFWTGEEIGGPRTIERRAPLETMPVYVRDGAALFLWPALRWLDEKPPEFLKIDLYPPASGRSESSLYEDDGISRDYESGVFSRRRVHQERLEDGGLSVTIRPREGPFQPPPRTLKIKVRTGSRPRQVLINGTEARPAKQDERPGPGLEQYGYLKSEGAVTIEAPDEGGEVAIELRH